MPCYDGTTYWGGCFDARPAYGCNAVTWPLVYDESVSLVQQIAYIMGAVNEVYGFEQWLKEHAISDERLNEALAELNEKTVAREQELLQQLTETDAKLAQQIDDLRTDFAADQETQTETITTAYMRYIDAEIKKIIDANASWDVTVGQMRNTKLANRDMFAWAAVLGLDCEQLAEHTVDEIDASNLTARGLATYGYVLEADTYVPSGCFDGQPPTGEGTLEARIAANTAGIASNERRIDVLESAAGIDPAKILGDLDALNTRIDNLPDEFQVKSAGNLAAKN